MNDNFFVKKQITPEWQKHWKDMPEFNSEDLMPYRQIIVSFTSEEDVQNFAKMVNQKITLKTKFLWFPKKELNNLKNLRYIDES